LDLRGTDGLEAPHRSIEGAAAEMIRKIRSVRPRGPYLLGGYSLGGEVAFEIARRLRIEGEEIRLLALIDTHTAQTRREVLNGRRNRSARAANGRVPYGRGEKKVRRLGRHLKRYARSIIRGSRRKSQELRCALYIRAGRPVPRALRKAFVKRAYQKASDRYVLRPYDGRIAYFRAVRVILNGAAADPALAWYHVAEGGIDVYDLPGSHNLTKEPYVGVVARFLRDRLDKAQVA
jgi:thioesterase domain-containing protein